MKALGAEQQILRRFERLSEQAAAHTSDVVRLADDAQSFASMVSILTQMATATVGAILAINGEISIGVVACSTMLAGRVIQPLLRLVSAWNEIQGVIVAEEIAKPIFDLPESDRLERASRPIASSCRPDLPSTMFGSRTATGRHLCSPERTSRSCRARSSPSRGERQYRQVDRSAACRPVNWFLNVATCWSTASRPRSAVASKRGSVAVVDTEMPTVRGSVLNNLTLFRDTEQLETARAAARVIGLEGDINRLPRGYDTRLGEAATETLPVGLLQRIAIARAIAGNPRLLILDEANNSFDHGSDLALSQGLVSLKGKITIVLITNRPSFAAIADRQFTLVDGKFCQLEQPRMPTQIPAGTAGAVA